MQPLQTARRPRIVRPLLLVRPILPTGRRRETPLGRVRPKAIWPNRLREKRAPVHRTNRGRRTNRLRRRRLGRVRLVRPKAIRLNRPHAQRTPIPRMKRRRRTNRLRRQRLGRARPKRARPEQVNPLRSRKSRPHRRKRQALLRKRNPRDDSLIRNGLQGPVLLAAAGPFFLCKLALGRRSHRSTALAPLVRCLHGSAVTARREIFFCYNFLQPDSR